MCLPTNYEFHKDRDREFLFAWFVFIFLTVQIQHLVECWRVAVEVVVIEGG